MTDFDPFERHLASALQADADRSVGRYEPSSIARTAIANAHPGSIRRRVAMTLGFRRPSAGVAYLLAILLLVLALVIGAIAAGALRPRRLAPSGWAAASAMTAARTWHTATRLGDGRVLVTGGAGGDRAQADAELYDPRSGRWTTTGSMLQGRQDHTATLLPDGTVLVAGGSDGRGEVVAFAELYDPGTGTWTALASMAQGRSGHTATLLQDRRVLVVGGGVADGSEVTSAELFDPRARTWVSTGAMVRPRFGHSATLLADGKVLVAGGFSSTEGAIASAELYDPSTGTWSATGTMAGARAGHTATLLPDGKVLVAGGSSSNGSFQPVNSAEVYDPVSGTWSETGSMHGNRVYAAAVLLSDGTVLVAGGSSTTSNVEPVGPVAPAEVYDPGSGSWTVTGRMTAARSSPTATLLDDGRVLVAGGKTKPIFGTAFASAELYDPRAGTR